MQTVPVEAKEWNQIPYNLSYSQLLATMWLFGNELWSSGRAVKTLNRVRAHVLFLFLFLNPYNQIYDVQIYLSGGSLYGSWLIFLPAIFLSKKTNINSSFSRSY